MTVIDTLMTVLHVLLAVEIVAVMGMWNRSTSGRWRKEPAGRALMAVLVALTAVTASTAHYRFLEGESLWAAVLSDLALLTLFTAVGSLGITILKEQRREKRRRMEREKNARDSTNR